MIVTIKTVIKTHLLKNERYENLTRIRKENQ